MEMSHLILYFFLLFIFILLVKNYTKSKSGNPGIWPPGPWKLPLVGNLHQLIGSLPHQALKTLAQKHGPVMFIRLGELPVIVVSSPKIVKEITKTNDGAFADRVELMFGNIILYGSTDLASTPYGEYWRLMRKLCVVEFLSPKKVRSFYNLMEDEVLRLVDSIRGSKGLTINLTQKIVSIECGIICRATVGRGCKDQESLITVVKEATAIAATFNVADLFPSVKFLHFLSNVSKKRFENVHERIDCILEDIIQQHEEKRISGKGDEAMEEEDLLDAFLRVSEKKDLEVPITRDNIKSNILEMFVAGIETSSIVVEWAMSEMMKNPKVLQKAQAEVREIVQGKERFKESDIQKLKYLKMVIKETLRLHPPGPFLFPRRCREQSKIDGYDIPINTVVMINAWAIGRDPEFWRDPEKFEPERFEDAATDFNGNHFEFIPFGAGRRKCPGIAFSLATVELSLAHLLFHFDWKIPGGEKLDMTENFGTSCGRKNNLCLIAENHHPIV